MVASEPVVPEGELPPRLPKERGAGGVLRRIHIRRNVELRKYGFTQGCRGCMAAETSGARAGSGLNLPSRPLMLNERGSR